MIIKTDSKPGRQLVDLEPGVAFQYASSTDFYMRVFDNPNVHMLQPQTSGCLTVIDLTNGALYALPKNTIATREVRKVSCADK